MRNYLEIKLKLIQIYSTKLVVFGIALCLFSCFSEIDTNSENLGVISNSELPRRQVLSAITGDRSTEQTYLDGGILYNLKSVGIVDYYYAR